MTEAEGSSPDARLPTTDRVGDDGASFRLEVTGSEATV